jgi:hypothetical protein
MTLPYTAGSCVDAAATSLLFGSICLTALFEHCCSSDPITHMSFQLLLVFCYILNQLNYAWQFLLTGSLLYVQLVLLYCVVCVQMGTKLLRWMPSLVCGEVRLCGSPTSTKLVAGTSTGRISSARTPNAPALRMQTISPIRLVSCWWAGMGWDGMAAQLHGGSRKL